MRPESVTSTKCQPWRSPPVGAWKASSQALLELFPLDRAGQVEALADGARGRQKLVGGQIAWCHARHITRPGRDIPSLGGNQ